MQLNIQNQGLWGKILNGNWRRFIVKCQIGVSYFRMGLCDEHLSLRQYMLGYFTQGSRSVVNTLMCSEIMAGNVYLCR